MPTLDDAIRILQRGDYKEGARVLRQLLRKDPNNPQILYNLGMAHSEQGQLEESIDTLEKCIALAPDMSNAYAALGFSYARIGKYKEAAQKTRQSLELDPDNFYGWKNLGGVYAKQRRFEEALEALEKANSLQKDVPEVLYALALVHEEMGDMREADTLYQRIIRQNRSAQFTELAERARTQFAHETLKARGPRIDVVMYMVGAMKKFETMSLDQIRNTTLEIAMLGRQGLDINDPTAKYTLRSLEGQFTGLHLLSYMHVGFQKLDPAVDAGTNLEEEYEAALQIFEKGSNA
jgi:Flp pilus assembly protein TadD